MSEPEPEQLLEEIRLLSQRLERISVDSIWARRSSGHRGALLKWADNLESYLKNPSTHPERIDIQNLLNLIQSGYKLLEKAARENFQK